MSRDWDGAMETLEEVLAEKRRVLGPDHPDLLATRRRLATWWESSGDWAGANEALAHLLAEHERVLGPDHPETRAMRRRLARWRMPSYQKPKGGRAGRRGARPR